MSAWNAETNGPLWYRGPGISAVLVSSRRQKAISSQFTNPGRPDTISFGRPVLPPDVGAFHAGETRSGSGPSSSASSTSVSALTHARPATSPGSARTTSAGSASATIASSSAAGSRDDTG